MGLGDNIPPAAKLGVVGLTLPVFIIYVIVLVGCLSLSPGIPALYLFLLEVNNVNLRVGYFAMCAVDNSLNGTSQPQSNNSAGDATVCVPTMGLNASQLSIELFNKTGDVVPTLDLALNLQRNILVPVILIAAFLMLFGAILFALVKVTQMKLTNPETREATNKQLGIFKPLALATVWMAICFAFAAALSSTMSTGALNFIIPVLATNIQVTGGKLVQAMQYVAFVFGGLFGLAATILLPERLEQQGGVEGDEFGEQNEKDLDGDDEAYEEELGPDGEPIPREPGEGEEDEQYEQFEGQDGEQDPPYPDDQRQDADGQGPPPDGEYDEYDQGQYDGQAYEGEEYDQQQPPQRI